MASADFSQSKSKSVTAAEHVASLPDEVKSIVKTTNFDSSIARFVYLEKRFFVLQIRYSADNDGTFSYNFTGPDVSYRAAQENIGAYFWQKEPVAKSNFYEFVAVRKGRFDFYYGDGRDTLRRGECALLNPNLSHRKEYLEDCDIVEICLSADMMRHLIHSVASFRGADAAKVLEEIEISDLSSEKAAVFFRPLADDTIDTGLSALIAELDEKLPGYVSVSEGYIERIFSKIFDPLKFSTTVNRRKVSRAEMIFRDINLLLEKHNACITGDFIQKELGYNKDYLNRIVKKYSGMSLKEYCDYIKMKRVAAELLETDKSVNEIIEEMQFSGSSTFYRQFKKFYRMSPDEYRSGAKVSQTE